MPRTLLLLSLGLASVFFALPARAESKANPLDKVPSSFAKLDNIRIHYKSIGSGDTALVFIHGWGGDMRYWRDQIPAFAGKMRVLLIDLPGHGQSDKPKTDYTMDLFAKAVNAMLEDAHVDKAVLVGHSMGTPVIRQFYRLFPNKTRGLVVVDGSLRGSKLTKEQLDSFVNRFTGPDFKGTYHKFTDSMFTPNTPAAVREDIKQWLPSAPQYVAVSAMKAMFDPAIWTDNPIHVPTLVIMAKSPRWSADYQAYIRKLAPGVEYHAMDGVGHLLMMEKPDEFNGILAAFLRKQGLLKN